MVLLSGSANSTTNPIFTQISIDASLLQDGDIIFRRGTDAVSKAVLAGDTGAMYSHVGLVVRRKNEALVVHAVPAETAWEVDEVKIESLSVFASPSRASAIAVLRLREGVQAKDNAKRATAYAVSRVGSPFDFSFDDNEDQNLYCTELVWRAYLATGVRIVNPNKLISFPLLPSKVIPPSAIWQTAILNEVKHVINKTTLY